MKQALVWILGLAIIAFLAWMIIAGGTDRALSPQGSPDTLSEQDTTIVIEQELAETDLGDINQELSEIDELLQQL